jgi:hypothetical protein
MSGAGGGGGGEREEGGERDGKGEVKEGLSDGKYIEAGGLSCAWTIGGDYDGGKW